MEISAIEINLLTKKVATTISGYFLSGIYSIEGGVLLRFDHSTKPEKLVAVSSFAPWITTKNLSLPQASKFASRLRDSIERSKVVAAEQVGNERISKFSFEGKKNEKRNLYAEFFSHGNLILTDASDDTILDVSNPKTFRHRNLVAGEKYVLPPSRGIPLQGIDKNSLESIFRESINLSENPSISAIKWFGRSVGTSRKFVEEIFDRARIDPNMPLRSLNQELISKLTDACSELRVELEKSDAGYILIPVESSGLDPDVCPIVPRSWIELSNKKLAQIQSYPSLSDVLDEVQIEALVLSKRRQVSALTRAKAEELASAIAKQLAQIEWNQKTSNELRMLAGSLIRESSETIGKDLIDKLREYEILEVPKEYPNQFRFASEPRAFLKSYVPTSLASRLFDEAKRLEANNRRLEQVMQDLEEQKKALTEQGESQENRATRSIVADRRERQWFERYRWFVSSDDRLVVGGRDATSNSIVINKYTRANDVVFHADLQGSPFFILGNSGERQAPSDELALEIAEAAVSFSRAWKDELGSADAFWVYGDQVKKSAPSGEYLPRGSFFIEGKKNFVRHVRVGLSVGVTSSLPKEDMEIEDGQVIVTCGPHKSIEKHCVARLRFSPGKEKSSDFARKAKQKLVGAVKDEDIKEATKKLSIDEIIRVLPAGGYKLVVEK